MLSRNVQGTLQTYARRDSLHGNQVSLPENVIWNLRPERDVRNDTPGCPSGSLMNGKVPWVHQVEKQLTEKSKDTYVVVILVNKIENSHGRFGQHSAALIRFMGLMLRVTIFLG